MWADDFADIVGLAIVDGVFGKIDLLELLEWLVVFWGDEPEWQRKYVFLILMQSSMSETLYLMKASLFLTYLVLILLPWLS